MALLSGLSAAIMNPYSSDMLKAYYSYLALSGMDDNCMDFINFASNLFEETSVEVKKEAKAEIAAVYGSYKEWCEMYHVSKDFFEEEFFETKKVLYVQI